MLDDFIRLLDRSGLEDRLPPPGASLCVGPLPGASAAGLTAALARGSSSPKPVVVVTRGPGAAEVLRADLETLDPALSAGYFPQREQLPHEEGDFDPESAGQRVETLAALLGGRLRVVVTTARALVERTAVPAGPGPLELTMEVGGETGRDALIRRLERMGFRRVHTVEELGQFAVRGGIVDIFPFGTEEPYRLELWGDEIASLRRFDLLTQRSTQTLDRVEILPLELDAGPASANASAGDGGGAPDRPGPRSASAATTRRSLLELLPESALLFDLAPEEGERVRERLWRDACGAARRDGGGAARAADVQGPLLPPENARERLAGARRLLAVAGAPGDDDPDDRTSADGHPRGDGARTARGDGDGPTADALDTGLRSPPAVERDMVRLVDALAAAEERGDRVVVLSDNEGQMERLEEIVAERGGEGLARSVTFGLGSLSGGFRVPGGPERPSLLVLTDHEIFQRTHRPRRGYRTRAPASLASVASLQPGDYVVHMDHGIGRYRGLERVEVGGEAIETLKIEYADADVLRVPHYRLDLIEKWSAGRTDGEPERPPRVHKIGGKSWQRLKRRTVDSIQETAAELLELYARREVADGHAFSPGTKWQREMESAFLYEETPDQLAAWEDVKADMEAPRPMDRLLCGDVGFGKTEVAMRAAFKAVQDGKQVAVLAPTTVLVEQHLHTFRERLAGFPVRVEALSRFQAEKEQRETLEALEGGQVDIVVGTHRLLSDDVAFRRLGLLVVDEEQRFGVRQKEKLKAYKHSVDVLTLTATPIPRTLQLALGDLRDLSVIQTPPRERRPVVTHVMTWSDPILRDAMRRELDRGGQVFFVHDRVETIESLASRVRKLVPDARVTVAHGQMPEARLEGAMRGLVTGEVDVLVCTSIIQNGLDVPDANTMIVHRSDRFGLSQLYQLRGRVGRSHHRAYCYLLVPRDVTPEAERRLRVLEHHTELGSGYDVALKDLEMRGAGNLLGSEQSGFAQAVGYDTYRRLLRKTVSRLKGEEEAAPEPTQVSVGGEAYLPDDYILDPEQKMHLYRRISRAEGRKEVEELREELRDRFGPLPRPARRLLEALELKLLGTGLQAEWIRVSEEDARIHFREDAVPRMAVLRDAFHDRQLRVEVRRTRPLSLVLEKAGPEPLLPTLLDALSLLARTGEAAVPAGAGSG